MSIVVSPEVERALAERAQSEGTTPDLLADSYLSERLFPSGSKVPAQPRNLAEYLADHIGVLSSVVSVFFYLRVVVMMYMSERDARPVPPPVSNVAMVTSGGGGCSPEARSHPDSGESSQLRTICLSYDGCARPGRQSSAGQ